MMEIKSRQSDKLIILSVNGSIDALTSDQLTDFLYEQIKNGKQHILLDLGQVKFMSSAGLRVILSALKQIRQQGGDLCLAAAQATVAKVLKMSGFMNIIKCYDDIHKAEMDFNT